MKKMILVALTVLSLGAGVANAAQPHGWDRAPGTYTGLTGAGG
jgi:hypothetical protein